jgi:hypothetical protein
MSNAAARREHQDRHEQVSDEPWNTTGRLMFLIHSFSKESEMRRTILTLASLAALITLASPPAQAHPANDRYCLQGRIWGYPGNCQFASYQQCLATASGTSAYCGINPRYAFSQQRYY